VPAWYSATRFGSAVLDELMAPNGMLTVTLPREADDPADALVRRMGFAGLKALGMETGMSTMRWHRKADGTPIIANIAASPPSPAIVSLMDLAYGADMYRVWGNAVVNGVFAPIPRLYAAGGVFFSGETSMAAATARLDEIARTLGDLTVRVQGPATGVRTRGIGENGFILVRHADTMMVDEAIKRIAETTRS
jgi:hypothetical protein